MSDTNIEEAKVLSLVDNTPSDEVDVPKDSAVHEENPMPSPEEEEEIIKKKYGGILPKKPPLISKDHERAFFDSADWALRKQGAQKAKGPIEDLRPKLQPTQHHHHRSRSAYAPTEDGEVDNGNNSDTIFMDQSCKLDAGSNSNVDSGDKSCSN